MKIEEKLKLGALAAWKAGVEILQVYATDFSVEYKEDASPVTEADQLADQVIHKILGSDTAPIISEETKKVGYEIRKDWKKYWLADPLDGTKEFAQKNDEFTVNIAYMERSQPLFGILYAPAFKQMYLADVSQKKVYSLSITDRIKEEDFQALEHWVKPIHNPKNTFQSIAVSRSHLDDKTQAVVEACNKNNGVKLIRMGSALKYAKLLTGEVDLYFRFSPTMEWDNAAGHALCLASGLTMYSLPNKGSIDYNSKDLYSPYFAAGTPKAVKILLENL